MKKSIAVCLIAAMITGCAGARYRPIVDGNGGAQYESDLAACQAYAGHRPDAGTSAVAGAVVGAGIGLLFAIASGGRGFRNAAAGVGAVSGGLSAGAAAEGNQRAIIQRCMAGRGYRVLD